ncbi:hypothetical protein LUZ60_009273 [Juncus effusus]|nr:hypothetical protein LUZ60_009273 [Juncus effusus]
MWRYESEMAGGGDRDVFIEIGRISVESSDHSSDSISLEIPTTDFGSQDRLQLLVQDRLNTIQKNLDTCQPFKIFRAPPHLREKATKMYEPKMVSIGPYHHGKETLRTLEEHKWRCLHDFLASNPKINMEVYLQEMRLLELRARQCYNESIEMESDEFVLMLLLDGCFILQYYLKKRDNVLDTFFSAHWSVIYTDLILLENQIPFFIVHKLAFLSGDSVDHTNCRDKCPLLDLIFPLLPKPGCLRMPKASCGKVSHLLHFYYECMVSHLDQTNYKRTQPRSMKTRSFRSLWSSSPSRSGEDYFLDVFPCATVLHESGVTFRRKKNPRDMFDITFHDGVMEMPLMSVGGPTQILFTNVIAFEQSQYTSETTFTSFARLLDSLIDTGNDVAFLRQCNVLQPYRQTDQETAYFFNSLADGTSFDYRKHYFGSVFKKVIQYSNSTWPKYRARLMHDYFSNPWTSISVFAGIILLGLTIAQTGYTIYSAYHR